MTAIVLPAVTVTTAKYASQSLACVRCLLKRIRPISQMVSPANSMVLASRSRLRGRISHAWVVRVNSLVNKNASTITRNSWLADSAMNVNTRIIVTCSAVMVIMRRLRKRVSRLTWSSASVLALSATTTG